MKSVFFLLSFLIILESCQQSKDNLSDTNNQRNWKWPDSLDAIVAAPASHKILFEDSVVRILRVTVNPNQLEPVHSHRWRSLAWPTKSSPFTLYNFDINENNKLILKDSFSAKLELNKVQNWKPEKPHSIRNLGNDTLVLYRVEFKK